MPPSIDAAFVVITHLGPHRETLLAEILARQTSDAGRQRCGRHAAVEPDHVYVLPSNSVLTDRTACTLRAASRQRRPITSANPVDIFLAALAGSRARAPLGIMLSGSGSDGTLGIKAIKERGGFTIAQGRGGAGPGKLHARAAIAAGWWTSSFPSRRSARALPIMPAASARRRLRGDGPRRKSEATGAEGRRIYAILRKQVGHDFSGYKERTFMRRVRRRMQVTEIGSSAPISNGCARMPKK